MLSVAYYKLQARKELLGKTFCELVLSCIKTAIIVKFINQSINQQSIHISINQSISVNVSIGCEHQWMSTSGKVQQSVCTMCNCCCDRGVNCSYNDIMGCNIRECGCLTEVTGCKTCGICRNCAHTLWVSNKYILTIHVSYDCVLCTSV